MSTFTDKTLKCLDCNSDFTYTAAEQELHKSLGYQTEPKRCTPCREAKRNRKGDRPRGGGAGPAAGGAPRPEGGGGGRGDEGSAREYFMAICSECGKEAQLPFKPRGDRPVYCSDCFGKRRSGP
jgi:CxxC-x17-CxxC domain-containing protein